MGYEYVLETPSIEKGKLLATVTYIENGCEQKWELCYVDKYLKKEKREDDEAGHPPYHGIIGALSEIPKKACYITSRDFPHDVRFFRGTNTVSMDIYSWLGREVFFHARKGVNTPFMSFYVIGSIEPEPKSSAVTIYSTFDKFFSLKLEVEYIGCTDENGLIIVWSDKWEFIADSYSVFKNLEFGIYRVEIVRQYVPNQFPRWKLKKIFDIVESYGSNSGKRPVERPRIHASIQASNERIGNHENKKNDDSGIDAEEEEGGSTSLKGSVGEETPRKRIEVHAQYRDVK
ncbi:hypothetical protein OESDEN_17382 [Oesophagostomum dentatum]|uniref:Uncharacterized protein n=1 Tax=Oesophagostomum dentatum TaxID=61180 RepID=A0A0B1SC83_OESDE|nr:hypothetical protein OESDEN_17382 [Oesophagostomum dentatum]